MSNLTLFF